MINHAHVYGFFDYVFEEFHKASMHKTQYLQRTPEVKLRGEAEF